MNITPAAVRTLSLTLCFCIAFLPIATGQENEQKDRDRLIQSIREADRKIDKLISRREQQEAQQTQKIKELKQANRNRADRILTLRQDAAELLDRIDSANETHQQLETKIKEKRSQRDAAVTFAKKARRKLLDTLSTLPPSKRRKQQRSDLKSMEVKPGNAGDAIETLLSVLTELLDEGLESQLFRTSVRTPEGRMREADVLRIGRALIAYQTRSEKNVGIALKGETKFQWQTDLPTSFQKKISSAIQSMERTRTSGQRPARTASTITLPVDPTTDLSIKLLQVGKSLRERLIAGGPVMFPLGLIALVALVFILERTYTLSGERWGMNQLVQEVLTNFREGKPEDALATCRARSGALPAVLARLLEEREQDADDLQDEIEEAILHEMPRLERFLSALKVLAAVAPLLGLLGTVTGIIQTFDVLAVFGSGKQQLMAGGISEALITTATGLAIAIPILLIHGYFRSRVDTIVSDIERHATTLYNAVSKTEDVDRIQVHDQADDSEDT